MLGAPKTCCFRGNTCLLFMLGKRLGGGTQGMGQGWVALVSWLEAQSEGRAGKHVWEISFQHSAAAQGRASGQGPQEHAHFFPMGLSADTTANCPGRQPVTSGPALRARWPGVGGCPRLGPRRHRTWTQFPALSPHIHSAVCSCSASTFREGSCLPRTRRGGQVLPGRTPCCREGDAPRPCLRASRSSSLPRGW